MLRYVTSIVGLCAALLVALIAAPAAVAGDPCYHGFEIPSRTEASETQIKVAPCAFGPTVAHVAVGSTVTFFNGPDFTHLITGANAEWGSRDVELQPNQEVSYRFDKPGTYPYLRAPSRHERRYRRG
jgi:plastocyanin